jgi:hypothetical protein
LNKFQDVGYRPRRTLTIPFFDALDEGFTMFITRQGRAASIAKFSSKSCITFAVMLGGSFVNAQDLPDEGIRDGGNEIFP